jgi:hypothetical protein
MTQTQRITFTVPVNATCGDVSKAVIKMLERNYQKGPLSKIMYFIEDHFKGDYFDEEAEN